MYVPILVGNCVGYEVAMEIMETGVHGVLVGVGPGAACTTREVTGFGIPQVTATILQIHLRNWRQTFNSTPGVRAETFNSASGASLSIHPKFVSKINSNFNLLKCGSFFVIKTGF